MIFTGFLETFHNVICFAMIIGGKIPLNVCRVLSFYPNELRCFSGNKMMLINGSTEFPGSSSTPSNVKMLFVEVERD